MSEKSPESMRACLFSYDITGIYGESVIVVGDSPLDLFNQVVELVVPCVSTFIDRYYEHIQTYGELEEVFAEGDVDVPEDGISPEALEPLLKSLVEKRCLELQGASPEQSILGDWWWRVVECISSSAELAGSDQEGFITVKMEGSLASFIKAILEREASSLGKEDLRRAWALRRYEPELDKPTAEWLGKWSVLASFTPSDWRYGSEYCHNLLRQLVEEFNEAHAG